MRIAQCVTTVAVCSVACDAAVGQAQSPLLLSLPGGNVFDGSAPVQVELWVTFSNMYPAFEKFKGDVAGSDTSGLWSSISSPLNLSLSLGLPASGSVADIFVINMQFPLGGFIASTANPILIWSGYWSTETLTPRTVSLDTMTESLTAYQGFGGIVSIAGNEASAQIQVIPAPPALAFLALASGLASRRRRVRAQGRVRV